MYDIYSVLSLTFKIKKEEKSLLAVHYDFMVWLERQDLLRQTQ